MQQKNKRVLILTGFAPMGLPQLEEMGVSGEPVALTWMANKDTWQFSLPTLGPAVLAGYLRRKGIEEVEIRDFYFDGDGPVNADIVGISSTFMGVENVREIADYAKESNPAAYVVLGGPLSWSVSPSELLGEIANLDCIVMREGEETFLDLVNAIRSGRDEGSVSGVVVRKGGEIVETPGRGAIDFGDVARPAWELMGLPSSRRLPVLPVETSRGCPYNCHYCSEVHYWGKPVRYRTSESVLEEIGEDVAKLGIRTFRFTDSCFSAPEPRSAGICDAIHNQCSREGVEIRWSSYARLDNLSRDLLEKMKRSGCVALDIGMESGAESVLRRMGRKYSPGMAVEVARNAREAGIITNFNVVIGFPGETEDTIERTFEIIERAEPDTFSCFLLFLAPNTDATLHPEIYGIEGSGLNWRHDSMTSEQAAEAMARRSAQVSRSVSFPGGEYAACYLTSIGYSQEEIRGVYRAVGALLGGSTDGGELSIVGELLERVKGYF